MPEEVPPDEMYYGYGINGSTGRLLDEPLTPLEVGEVARKQVEKQTEAEERVLRTRAAMEEPSMGVAMGVDVKDLGDAGWGVILARGADAGIKEALQPLLDHRQKAAGQKDEKLFKVYEGDDGYLPEFLNR